MREWFERQLNAGLPAFAGSEVSGTLAVKEELINELLAQWLASPPSAHAAGVPPLAPLATAIKRVAVRAQAGVVMVDFDISL